MALQKTIPFSFPSGPWGGANSIRPYGWVRVILRNTDAIPQPGTCGPSKNCPVFVHFGAVYEAYSIRPYNRVRAILRNIDAIFQLNTCGSSKNCPVFVPFGAACVAYSIRPYNRVRARVQKMDLYSFPTGPWGGAYSIRPYNRVRARVRNTDATPRPATCNPTKYRRDLLIGGVGVFGRWGGGGYRLRGRRA